MDVDAIIKGLSEEEASALTTLRTSVPGVTVSLCVKGLTDHTLDELGAILTPRPLGLAVRARLLEEEK